MDGLKDISKQNFFEAFDKGVRDSFELGNFTLSSGIATNYFFDFLKMRQFSLHIFRMLSPKYIPVGILTGGGLITESAGVNSNSGLVDVKKGIFYPPQNKNNSKEITLIDDVYTTGVSLLKAERLINDAGYNVVERKVLLWRQEPKFVVKMIEGKFGYIPFAGVDALIFSQESEDGERPKYEYYNKKELI